MNVLSDIHHAIRALLRAPSFVVLATCSLALGIGVNAAIFSLYEQMLLQPLAVHQPERLVNLASPGIRQGSTSNNTAGSRDEIFSYPMMRDLRAQDAGIALAAHRSIAANLALGAHSSSGRLMLVSDNYFDVLGLVPVQGRLLQAGDEDGAGARRVAVLSHAYWRNQLGGDTELLGQSMRVNGQLLTIVGIAPEGFRGTTLGAPADAFAPISLADLLQPDRPATLEDRRNYWVYLFGRLDAGTEAAAVAAKLEPAYRNLLREIELPLQEGLDDADAAAFVAKPLLLTPGAQGQSSLRQQSSTGLSIMLAVSGLILLVACLNVANLQLARGTVREGEYALRAAIGAGRLRLLRILAGESLVLAALGAAAALPVAQLVLEVLSRLIPSTAAAALDFSLRPGLITAALVAALLSILLFGLLPARQLGRVAPMEVLRQSATRSPHRFAARFRTALALAQVAISTASLVLAGLFAQSLNNIFESDPGMQIDRVISFALAPQRNGYDPEQSRQLIDRVEQRLAELPGVEAAASTMVPVLSGNEWTTSISVEGFDVPEGEEISSAYNQVGNAFFATFGIKLLAGRAFTDADSAGRPQVAIVNRAFAEQFGLGDTPIGRRLGRGGGASSTPDIEIVGMVETTSYDDIRVRHRPQFFTPRRQSAHGESYFVLRTRGEVDPVLQAIPRLIAEIDPALPVQQLGTVEQDVRANHAMEVMVGTLSTAFAVLATALAALGVYGVINYGLSRRLREFGLRMALGAAPTRLRGLVLGQSARLFFGGAAIGIVLGAVAGRSAEALLFGLSGHDPLTLGGALVILAAVVLVASWLPARRATLIDPSEALRHD